MQPRHLLDIGVPYCCSSWKKVWKNYQKKKFTKRIFSIWYLTRVLVTTLKYSKVQVSTQKYTKELKSQQKYSKVHKKYSKVLKSSRKYSKRKMKNLQVLESTQEYLKITWWMCQKETKAVISWKKNKDVCFHHNNTHKCINICCQSLILYSFYHSSSLAIFPFLMDVSAYYIAVL